MGVLPLCKSTPSLFEFRTVQFSNLKFVAEALTPSAPEDAISQFCTAILLPPLTYTASPLAPFNVKLSNTILFLPKQ